MTPETEVTYRPLRYLSYPTVIGTSGEVDMRIVLHRSGSTVAGELPVDVVRAVHDTEKHTYARKRQNQWRRVSISDGCVHLRVPGETTSRLEGVVRVTAVAVASEGADVVAGVLLSRNQLHIEPRPVGGVDLRQPHLDMPGMSQLFRQYALFRLVEPVSAAVEAWMRCITPEVEVLAAAIGRLTVRVEDLGLADTDQAAEIRNLNKAMRDAVAKNPRLIKVAVRSAALAIVSKLAIIALDPLFRLVSPEIQQVVVETSRFVDRFFAL